MRLTITDYAVLLIIALMVGNFAWVEIDEYRGHSQGTADAETDLRQGKLGEKGSGKPGFWQREYEVILSEQYGATYEHVAACYSSPFERAYIAAYNKTMGPAWRAKGVDLQAVVDEARSRASRKLARD